MITPSFSLTATERVLPKLALDFTTANLDSRVTFTRTTSASNPATYVNNNGVVTNATNNQPRFDYDPLTGVCAGLLIEEARTNDLFPSGAINSGWTAQNATVDATPITAPDGTESAYKFTENTATGEHRLLPPHMAWVNGTTYSVSFFAKAGGRTSFGLFDGSVIGTVVAVFNLTAKTASITFSTGGNSCSIREFKDGWFRCTYTQTSALTNAVSAYFFRIVLRNDSNQISYTGDGTSGIYVFGGQRETGGFSTSYIPTTSAAATRNADVATMTGTNFSDWYNFSEGTFEVQYIRGPAATSGGGRIFASGVGGSNSYGIYIANATSTQDYLYIRDISGDAVAAAVFSAGAIGTISKFSVAYKVNDFAWASNGAAPATDTSGVVPSQSNELRFGRAINTNASYLNGWISKLNYYPQRLTNNEVRAISR